MDKRPIGIFDSGVGGLTVVDKVSRLLPNEKIIYFGDTARVPYGNKSKATVTRFSKEIVKFLLRFKVKLIIVACNTATSLSLTALSRIFSVPIVGVINPGVREALKVSKQKRIGVIGTEATIASGSYRKKIKSLSKGAFVTEKACPLFVPLVENRWINNDITLGIAKKYLSYLRGKKIDTLILGCTHYPLLKKTIKKVTGSGITLIDSSKSVAEEVLRLLKKKGLLNKNARQKAKFFVSDQPHNFAKMAEVFLGKKITAKKKIL
ncbi:MAG: glutamate racemase [Candidatus Omnitrophota bacterium]